MHPRTHDLSSPARRLRTALLPTVVIAGLALGGVAAAPATAEAAGSAQNSVAVTTSPAAIAAGPGDHFDDVYYMQQHNTFEHGANITDTLDAGLRALELDVNDVGDWPSSSRGPYVSHDASSGDRNCSGTQDTRLYDCLDDVTAWLAGHPGAGPVQVLIDLKGFADVLGVPGPAIFNGWDAGRLETLDRQIAARLGSRLFTTPDLYRYAAGTSYPGTGTSLRQAVSSGGWPTLQQIGDRVVVIYTGGRDTIGHNQTQAAGLERFLGQGALPSGFYCPDVEDDPNELNPGGTVDGISTSTSQAIVCSNLASQDHYELTANRAAAHNQLLHLFGGHVLGNSTYAYNYVAVAHGVSIVGRDDVTDTFGGALPPVGKRRGLPGYFEISPTALPSACVDVHGGHAGNGTPVVDWDCNGGANQRFVYTAEGQLRPQSENPYCLDLASASTSVGTRVHTWDCDGGNSEKWRVTPDGRLQTFDNAARCLWLPNLNGGTQYQLQDCGTASQFILRAVPDWTPTAY